jgi:flagellar biosynthesis protein FliR
VHDVITFNLGWVEAVMLAAVRVTAFLVIAPPFSHNGIPARIKAMLGVGLAIAVAPTLGNKYSSGDTGAFFFDLIMQVVIGLVLGFLVMVAFSAVQSAGNFIDLFGGFQLAQAFDPQSKVNGAQFTRLFHLAALALLFSTDGYQLILGGLMRSFTAVPLGETFDLSASAEALTAGFAQMFLSALQIAGPLIVILTLADVGLGLLTRVAPAINAFSMSYPLKILITVSLGGVVFVALPRFVTSLTGEAIKMMTAGMS